MTPATVGVLVVGQPFQTPINESYPVRFTVDLSRNARPTATLNYRQSADRCGRRQHRTIQLTFPISIGVAERQQVMAYTIVRVPQPSTLNCHTRRPPASILRSPSPAKPTRCTMLSRSHQDRLQAALPCHRRVQASGHNPTSLINGPTPGPVPCANILARTPAHSAQTTQITNQPPRTSPPRELSDQQNLVAGQICKQKPFSFPSLCRVAWLD